MHLANIIQLLFDFGLEQDAVANAQACLLLTYRGPNYNIHRVNCYWLTKAIRFARITRADSHDRIRDPRQSKTLKRLWWGVILRDRTLSLGLRRSLQIDESTMENEDDVLQPDDFENELGRSPVHDLATQLRIVEVLAAQSRLMQLLKPALKLLYDCERIDERLEIASQSPVGTVASIQRCLNAFQIWYDRTIQEFPFPVSLDDAHETICIYANLLFSLHATAVSALNLYLLLIREFFPEIKHLVPIGEAKDALATANNDVTRRTQELVQVRLVKYLPITASAALALPLVFQSTNAAASLGSGMESSESRKLDVFTRMLKCQQQNFDGSDFCDDVLENVLAYARADGKFIGAMTNWRSGKEAGSKSSSTTSGKSSLKVDWANLTQKRPRLFLRLVLQLDLAFCTGGAPVDEDFPPELRRGMF